jgi:hypothetical protein
MWQWVPPETIDELNFDPMTGEPLSDEERQRWWVRFHPPVEDARE